MTDNRFLQFSFVRFLSILGVVIIHATAPYMVSLIRASNQGTPTFLSLVFLNQAARFCVPAFFIVSGFFTAYGRKDYFLKPEELKTYILKRFIRLLLPYLAWTLVLYVLPRLFFGNLKIVSTISAVLLGSTIEGGYFIIALAQLNLIGPLLIRYGKNRNFVYGVMIIASLIITELFFVAAGYGHWFLSQWVKVGFSYFQSTFLPWSSFYISGLMLGINYEKWLVKFRFWRFPAVFLASGFFALSIFDFYTVYYTSRSLNIAASFLKPSSIGLAYSTCAIILSSPPQVLIFQKLWKPIADGSYGIFLIHGAVLSVLLSIGFIQSHILIGVYILVFSGIGISLMVFMFIDRKFPKWVKMVTFGKAVPSTRKELDSRVPEFVR